MNGFHPVHLLEYKALQRDTRVVYKEIDKNQATSRPQRLKPEVWSNMSENSQQKEKRHWVIDKPKLGNARKLIDE